MKLSEARVNALRGRELVRQMDDEIRHYDTHPALRSALAFCLRTGRKAQEYEELRVLVRERRELLERRIERVKELAGLTALA